MPYITQKNREIVENIIKASKTPDEIGKYCVSPGELNYIITKILHGHIERGISYSNINKVIGVLECVKLELYRRIAVPYEKDKINENGDL